MTCSGNGRKENDNVLVLCVADFGDFLRGFVVIRCSVWEEKQTHGVDRQVLVPHVVLLRCLAFGASEMNRLILVGIGWTDLQL